jgi:hypothetical protein
MISFTEKKRLLVAESAALRKDISHQLDLIEESFDWVERGIHTGRAIQKGVPLLSIASSLYLAWRAFRSGKTTVAKVHEREPSFVSRCITRGIQLTNFISPLVSMLRTRPTA